MDVGAHYRFRLGQFDADLGASVFNLYDRTNVWYREFDLSSDQVLVTDVNYLGMTPNISFKVGF